MRSKRAKSALAGAAGAIALATVSLIKPWEGRELVAYKDIVGVWTICDGETKGVRPGMKKTAAECDAMLNTRVEKDFYIPLTKCIAGFEKKPIGWQAMMISLSYNVGVAAACGSTAAKLGRAGKFFDSCFAATRFNKAGGRVVQGLKNRREYGDAQRMGELELCLASIPGG